MGPLRPPFVRSISCPIEQGRLARQYENFLLGRCRSDSNQPVTDGSLCLFNTFQAIARGDPGAHGTLNSAG